MRPFFLQVGQKGGGKSTFIHCIAAGLQRPESFPNPQDSMAVDHERLSFCTRGCLLEANSGTEHEFFLAASPCPNLIISNLKSA